MLLSKKGIYERAGGFDDEFEIRAFKIKREKVSRAYFWRQYFDSNVQKYQSEKVGGVKWSGCQDQI